MTRITQLALAAGMAMLITTDVALAQFPGGGYSRPRGRGATQITPSVSPYLNLLRENRSFVPNYFTFVRPEVRQLETNMAQGAAIGQLETRQAQIMQMQQQLPTGQTPPLQTFPQMQSTTGHPTSFMNYLHYYPYQRSTTR